MRIHFCFDIRHCVMRQNIFFFSHKKSVLQLKFKKFKIKLLNLNAKTLKLFIFAAYSEPKIERHLQTIIF